MTSEDDIAARAAEPDVDPTEDIGHAPFTPDTAPTVDDRAEGVA